MNDKAKVGRSQPILTGFTPVPDALIQEFDLLTAVVLARVWRFEQGPKAKCFAAKSTVAKSLGISAKTVQRRLKLLVDQGYLNCLTPDRRHMPRDYTLTKTANTIMHESLGRTQHTTSRENGRTQSPTRLDAESHQVGRRVPPGWTQSPTRLDAESLKETILKKQQKKEIKKSDGDDHHDHPSSRLLADDFDRVKTSWIEVVGEMSVSHERKLKKYVEEFSCAIVAEAIGKMSDYAKNPNPAYLRKVLISLTKEPRGKYNSGRFAEFIE